jgi:phosphonate degradation associated HDIG domain protein
MSTGKNLLEIWEARGHLAYDGEGVSQLEHAWQCGQLAKAAGASDFLQLAAWLHDVGHLLADLPGTPTLQGVDDRHEEVGAEVLSGMWGPAVSQPVRLHVRAKRFMVARVAGYAEKLSADSVRSLALQGGPMSAAECDWFQEQPFSADAQRLRAWDDAAKRKGWFKEGASQAVEELRDLMARCSVRSI